MTHEFLLGNSANPALQRAKPARAALQVQAFKDGEHPTPGKKRERMTRLLGARAAPTQQRFGGNIGSAGIHGVTTVGLVQAAELYLIRERPGMDKIFTPVDAAQTPVQLAFEVTDALHRFGAGQDLRDAELFRSAWTQDAELDFVQPARRLGIELQPFRGRERIVHDILASLEPLVTTHTVSNARVSFDADRARLFALVGAQHVRRSDRTSFLLLKNFYECDLAHEEGLWRIAKMRIVNAWYEGDPRALFPSA
jgi:hypothetical protein